VAHRPGLRKVFVDIPEDVPDWAVHQSFILEVLPL
jgi:hypothetical protein